VVDGTVYVGAGFGDTAGRTGLLYAVDSATGEQKWAFTQPTAGVYSAPTVYEGTVYVGSQDYSLYAVDAATGQREWVFDTDDWVDSSPTVVADPTSSDSLGSRVTLGTLGHHGNWRYAGQSIDVQSGSGGSDTDSRSNESGSDGSGPGFGISGALVGLGGAGYLLKQRLDNADGE
jgi:PGF-CTERM protein